MKAILVIDMPSRCFGCKMHRVIDGENENEFMVFCCPHRRPINDLDERPSWCPLRPMPEKKNTSKLQYFGKSTILWSVREIYQNEGWNACLDEIEGETE